MAGHICVFISSTFRDMQDDREVLIKRVFPQLRKRCETRGIAWTEIDLRWGVTSEQQAEGKLLPYCFQEIERSRPYFIGLLAGRYGWVPAAVPEDLERLHPWLVEHRGCSVTELEILHGVLNDPGACNRALFYFRDPAYAASVPAGRRDEFLETGPDAAARRARLEYLKNRIRRCARDGALAFAPREDYPDPGALAELVLADFGRIIDELCPPGQAGDPLDEEIARHERFARSHVRRYVSRASLETLLDRHVEDDGSPLVVSGDRGCGKTTLLAAWADRWRQRHPGEVVIQHVVGASPTSGSPATVIHRVLEQVHRDVGFESQVPAAPEIAVRWFEYLLHQAADKRRFVLVIDGADQLDADPALPRIEWLPVHLHPACRLIVSASPGPILDVLRQRAWPVIEIEPLIEEERGRLVTEFLAACGKTLASGSMARIAAAPAAGNPRYLTWLLDELRYVDSADRLPGRLDACLRAEGIDALLALIVERWLSDYEEGCQLARRALQLLVTVRDGLSAEELVSALQMADRPAVSRAVATPFLFAAEAVLGGSDHQLIIRRGPMQEVIRAAIAATDADTSWAVDRLASHFESLEDSSDRKLRELPRLLARTERWSELHDMVLRPAVLAAMIERHRGELIAAWERLRTRFHPVTSHRDAWHLWQKSVASDRDRARAADVMGTALFWLGHHAASTDLLVEAAQIVERLDGRASEAYACAARTAGVALSQAGRGRDAARWLRSALDTFRRTVGLYHVATFTAMSNLAGCLLELGDAAAAEPLLRQIVDAEFLGHGSDNVRLQATSTLAGLLFHRGAWREAEALQREVLDALRRTAPYDDPALLAALNNLAATLEAQGRHDPAETAYREALAGRARSLGAEHPDTVQSMNNLAKLLRARGDSSEAETLLGQAHEIAARAPDADPVGRAVIAHNHALQLASRGDASAVAVLRDVLADLRALLSPDHPLVLGCLYNLGELVLGANHLADATSLLQQAVDGYVRTTVASHPQRRAAALALAVALARQGDRRGAASLLEAHGWAEQVWGEQAPAPPASPPEPEDHGRDRVAPSVRKPDDEGRDRAALLAVLRANAHDDLYDALEQFPFITSNRFIAGLEDLAHRDDSGAVLERSALLRHLASGKPLNQDCNPLTEALAVIRRAGSSGNEQMLVRLYPFLRAREVLAHLKSLAIERDDHDAATLIDRIAQFVHHDRPLGKATR